MTKGLEGCKCLTSLEKMQLENAFLYAQSGIDEARKRTATAGIKDIGKDHASYELKEIKSKIDNTPECLPTYHNLHEDR